MHEWPVLNYFWFLYFSLQRDYFLTEPKSQDTHVPPPNREKHTAVSFLMEVFRDTFNPLLYLLSIYLKLVLSVNFPNANKFQHYVFIFFLVGT